MILRDGQYVKMDDRRKLLGIIPARAGSKGLPNKNIKDFCGKPLIEWTFQAVKQAKVLNDVILTSDSEVAIKIAKNYEIEVPFIRPRDLSGDHSEMREVIRHALEFMRDSGREYTDVMILQPTSPFRSAEDIDSAWNSFHDSNAKTLLSVTEAGKYASNFMYKQLAELDSNTVALSSLNGKSLLPIRRQDLEATWWRNGAIYICKSENITTLNQIIVEPIIGHVMPWSRSVNIDDQQDLFYAEYIWNTGQLENGF